MEWVEVRGETLEQAKEEALDQLGVASDDAEFEIVQEPETRWLGIKKTEARVRARVRPTQPRPKRDSRNGRRSKRGSGQGGQSKQSNKGGSAKKQERGGGENRAKQKGSGSGGGNKRGGNTPGSGNNAKAGSDRDGRADDGAGGGSNTGGNKSRRSSGSKRQGNQKDGSKESTMDNNENAGGSSDRVAEPMPVEQQEAVAVEFLNGLAASFGLTATASTAMDDDVIIASVEGDDLGLMIGPKGGTMHAIQELARSAVQRQSDGRDTSRLMVDVAGYRARRRAALAEFTKSQAATVLENGQDLALEPMGSADRKAVHDAVLEIEGVRSISEGEEPRRRIVLLPDQD